MHTFDWDAYGRKVMSGEILVSEWTRFSIERHYADLKAEPKNGFWFSERHAQYALNAFLFMKHSKGAFAGKQFVPSPWQQFWIALAFGWRRLDGTRRYREVYWAVPRKNGKTTTLAAIALYMMVMDGEAGAEVYCAATKMEQAKLLYSEANQMINASALLKMRVKTLRDGIFTLDNACKLVPLGRDSKSMDGLNPSCCVIDEVHAHKTSEIYDVLKSALGARRQPMVWIITTAGFDLGAWGYEQHRYAEKVVKGIIQDDEFLPIIYTVDDPDKWDDPVEWAKANPNLGVSVYEDNLAADCERAKKQPSQQPNFKTKRLNIWLSSGDTWIPVEDWRKCAKPIKLEEFKGEKCWIGIDLAEKSDVAALCLCFKRGDRVFVHFRLYHNEYEVQKQENQHYRRWRDQNELIVTDGNATDFDVIRADLLQFHKDFNLVAVPYDPRFSSYFATKLLEDGLPMVEVTQTSTKFTEPVILIENLILENKLVHDGNSMVEWMMSNIVMRISKFTGLRQPTKESNAEKIDGPVAMMMAVGQAMAVEESNEITQGFVAL